MITARNGINHEFIYDFKKLVLRGPGLFKSIPDPKNVCYNPREVREMAEIKSFFDFMKLVLRGPGPFKFTLDPKTVCYRPRKRPQMPEITCFLRFYETGVTGSQTV